MLFSKSSTTGVDTPIQLLQSLLHDELLELWDLETADYEAYGRCYRNQKKVKSGYIPEVFKTGKEYKEVFVDDKIAALSFFGTSGRVTVIDNMNTTDVHLIFFVNLKKLKPSITWRADEEVRYDVFNILQDGPFSFKVTEWITQIDKVFTEYSEWIDTIKHRDMQPFHCFRFNMSLSYNNDCSFPINP